MNFALIPEPTKRRAKKGEVYFNRNGSPCMWYESAPTIEEYVIFRRVPLDRVTVRELEPAFVSGCVSDPTGAVTWWYVSKLPHGPTVFSLNAAHYPDAEQRVIAECARLNAQAARGEIPA